MKFVKVKILFLFIFSIFFIIFLNLRLNTLHYDINNEVHKLKVRNVREYESFKCYEQNNDFIIQQKGDYFVLVNFVKSSRTFKCNESVTYTTQADFGFLDNIPVLVDRWRGPISVAIYAPENDFKSTMQSIAYLRNCEATLIKEFVTFHIILLSGHMPKLNMKKGIMDSYIDEYNCKTPPPYRKILPNNTYRRKKKLVYPINIARNVARQSATTHFVFASDIELYPTRNFINLFLNMILNSTYLNDGKRKVFVLPLFEVLEGENVPENKMDLQRMLKKKKAFLFHIRICKLCHSVPKYKEWVEMPESEGLHVFTTTKRVKPFHLWEAFYVGTKDDPLFDERLSWEGEKSKMPQGYSMCLLDYDYLVLDNAFLIHKPGVKKVKEQKVSFLNLVNKTNKLIKTIKQELINMYGNRKTCYLI